MICTGCIGKEEKSEHQPQLIPSLFSSISFLNLNIRTFREIRQEFSKFGEIVRQTTGGGSNTDELVSISYADKGAAVRALQTHFTNKDYPYLDIAKGDDDAHENVIMMFYSRVFSPARELF